MNKKIIPVHVFLSILPFIMFITGYFFASSRLQQKTLLTPHLIGQQLQQALTHVSKHGLNIRLFREQYDALLPEGVILQQLPAPHSTIRFNQPIFVTITKKPQQPIMPDLVGYPLDYFADEKNTQNVKLDVITVLSDHKDGISFAQSPQAGNTLEAGKALVYVAAKLDRLFVLPNFVGELIEDVEEYLVSLGIAVEKFQAPTKNVDACENSIIIDQKPMAGSIVNLDKPLSIQLQI